MSVSTQAPYSMFTVADDRRRISALYVEKGSQGGIYLEEEDPVDATAYEFRVLPWEEYFQGLRRYVGARDFVLSRGFADRTQGDDEVVRAFHGYPDYHQFKHIWLTMKILLTALIKDRELHFKHAPQTLRTAMEQA